MKYFKISDDEGNGYYRGAVSTDIEYVDPVKYYSDFIINNSMLLEKDIVFLKDPVLATLAGNEFFYKRALEKLSEKYKEIEETFIPTNFIEILKEERSKNDQIQLLKGQSITPDQLIAYLFKAFLDHGYTFSQYTSEYLHKGLDKSQLPLLIELDGAEVKSIGKTDLTNGQLKNVVTQRRIIVAKFLDKGNNWHCFLGTLDGFCGEELGQKSDAHIHYISDKWGISRTEIVEKIKSGIHPSSKVHIKLLGYRNQSDDTSL